MKVLDAIKQRPDYDYSELQPFVFAPSGGSIVDIPELDEDLILASPFPLFSIELDGIAMTAGEDGVKTLSLICHELAPNEYEFFAHTQNKGNEYLLCVKRNSFTLYKDGQQLGQQSDDLIAQSTDIYNSYLSLTNLYLERLHNEKTGTTSALGRAKFKVGKQKKIFRPRGVIYVSKTIQENKKFQNKKEINWSHNWTVRAHWRKLNNQDSLGLNRLGERVVKGRTWIGSFKKGSDSIGRPKIRKVN